MGLGLIQTFHVKNFSKDAKSLTNWHFDSTPDLTWIFTCAVGLIVFLYGFIGFWLCERKRKVSRISFHRIYFSYQTQAKISCAGARVDVDDSWYGGMYRIF